MKHALINPNQLCSYGITVQDNPFSNAPILISTEDHAFSLPLVTKGTSLGVTTITPTNQELHNFSHIILYPEQEWDPHKIHSPKAL